MDEKQRCSIRDMMGEHSGKGKGCERKIEKRERQRQRNRERERERERERGREGDESNNNHNWQFLFIYYYYFGGPFPSNSIGKSSASSDLVIFLIKKIGWWIFAILQIFWERIGKKYVYFSFNCVFFSKHFVALVKLKKLQKIKNKTLIWPTYIILYV